MIIKKKNKYDSLINLLFINYVFYSCYCGIF